MPERVNRVNPFNPGPGFDPPYLAGRDGEIAAFSNMLESIKGGHMENMMVHGLRGVGKTVLLNAFQKKCVEANFLPVTRLQYNAKYSDPVKFMDALKHDLRGAIKTFSRLEKTKSKIESAVHYIRPTQVDVPGIVYYEPPYGYDSRTSLEDYLIEYLIKNWKVVEEGGYNGVVFLFDEFHTVRNTNGDEHFTLSDFLGALNEVQKNRCKYSAVLCGLPTIKQNIKTARSYSERMFKSLQVSNLSEADTKKAITKPLNGSEYKFSKDLLPDLVKDTGGYPYFIQFYARETLNRVDKNTVGIRDYKKIRDSITDQLGEDFFDQRMEELTESQQSVLYAMSKVPNTDITFSAVQKYTNMNKGTFSRHLIRLEDRGIIYKVRHGIYQFSLPTFREYLLRKTHKTLESNLR